MRKAKPKEAEQQEEDKDKKYVTESLDFINSNNKHFKQVLTNIVVKLNTMENKKWIELMNTMKEDTNTASNLKELIHKLILNDAKHDIIDLRVKYKDKYHAEYVKQCLELIQRPDLKDTMHKLLTFVMQDMQKNEKLMDFVKSFKDNKDNTDWKKMVGMLIPKGAQVKLNKEIIEQIKDSYFSSEKKFTQATNQDVNGVILVRGKITSGEFKKQMSIPTGILRRKDRQYIDVNPTDIELITQEPVKTEPVKTEPVKTEPVKTESAKNGGEQRMSKKHKKSIETVKKTRRKDRNITII